MPRRLLISLLTALALLLAAAPAGLAAPAASASDCDDEASAAAPKLTALQAKLTGAGRRAHVTVTFALDAPGEVKLTLERIAAGIASGKRCVAVPKQSRAAKRTPTRRGAKRCTRGVAVGGSFLLAGREGANTAAPRRWKGRSLTAGSYRVTATPTDAGGTSSTATFTLAAAR